MVSSGHTGDEEIVPEIYYVHITSSITTLWMASKMHKKHYKEKGKRIQKIST